MKLEWLIAIIGIAALLLAIAIVYVPQSQEVSAPESESSEEDSSAVMDVPAEDERKSYDIVIQDSTFLPGVLVVKTGTAVTWINKDKTPHTVTSEAGGLAELSSKFIEQNQAYTHTFYRKGTFIYNCALHRNEKGTVIVE